MDKQSVWVYVEQWTKFVYPGTEFPSWCSGVSVG